MHGTLGCAVMLVVSCEQIASRRYPKGRTHPPFITAYRSPAESHLFILPVYALQLRFLLVKGFYRGSGSISGLHCSLQHTVHVSSTNAYSTYKSGARMGAPVYCASRTGVEQIHITTGQHKDKRRFMPELVQRA